MTKRPKVLAMQTALETLFEMLRHLNCDARDAALAEMDLSDDGFWEEINAAKEAIGWDDNDVLGVDDEDGHELDEDGDPIHKFGLFETSRITGEALRHCQVPGCNARSMDGDEEDEDGRQVITETVHSDGLTDAQIAELADDHADSRYEDDGEAAFGREE